MGKEMQQMAAKKLATNQCREGDKYLFGGGVAQDFDEAIRWYQMAAEGGSGDAQYVLACIYIKGEALPQDFNKARFWLAQATKQAAVGTYMSRLQRKMRKYGIEEQMF